MATKLSDIIKRKLESADYAAGDMVERMAGKRRLGRTYVQMGGAKEMPMMQGSQLKRTPREFLNREVKNKPMLRRLPRQYK